jgi:Ras family protein A
MTQPRSQKQWISEVEHFMPNVPRLFVGLKKDLREDPDTIAELNKISQRPVSWEEASPVARKQRKWYS